MAEAQDVDSLKRRGRRRLVGAVALVLLAVIVLPMVFDPEPRRSGQPVSVRIPGEDDSSFAPKMAKAPPAVEKKTEEKKAEEKKAEEKKAPEQPVAEKKAAEAPKVVEQTKVEPQKSVEPAAEPKVAEQKKPEPKAEPKVAQAERARAEAALTGTSGFFVPVGAFSNAAPVTARLAEAKVPYYTEQVPTAKGPVTRVRAGPFSSKQAADKVHEQLKGLGFKPGNVAAKTG